MQREATSVHIVNDIDVSKKGVCPTRYISALMMREFMELVQMGVHKLDLDVEELMIVCCVVRESTRDIVQDLYLSREYGYEGKVMPTSERRPTSLKSISGALNMSRETARRKLLKIVDKGILIRVEKGYVFPEQSGAFDLTGEIRQRIAASAEILVKNINEFNELSTMGES